MLNNSSPVDFRSAQYEPVFRKLQGNILKGHGRDFTVNIFMTFRHTAQRLRQVSD
jgi:hypothetical protein